MLDISKFFQKFASLQAESVLSKEKIITAVKNISGLSIEGKNFGLQDGILRFNLSPVKKSEIFMHKDKILSELNSLGSAVRDIR
jgi:hypothetical protein